MWSHNKKLSVRSAVWVVFALILFLASGRAVAQFRVLHNFDNNGVDGFSPVAGVVFDSQGNIYGTTGLGGPGSTSGCGIVYELVAPSWTERILHNFNLTANDGCSPAGNLIFDSSGNLYGTTSNGGPYSYGTVFELVAASGWAEKVLHVFNGADGAVPIGSIAFDPTSNLYGTTAYGGTSDACDLGCGTVWELSPAGAERILHSFNGAPDGNAPESGVTTDSAFNLYGTTIGGGAYLGGTAFEIARNGAFTTLHSFGNGNDALNPSGSLVIDTSRNIYGVSSLGGIYDGGAVFEISPLGGNWTESFLYSFNGLNNNNGPDGWYPVAGLIADGYGNLYGTASWGGVNGDGTVVELINGGGGSWTFSLLHTFGSNSPDGNNPHASLSLRGGNLYGTTWRGGVYNQGAVFEIIR